MIESSRRLIGPNLYFAGTGAILEVSSASEQQCHDWERRLSVMLSALGWPPAETVARRHASGAILAFAVGPDRLFTATELNEWAWLGVVGDDVLVAHEAREDQAVAESPGFPSLRDFESARQTLSLSFHAESDPRLLALLAEARSRDLPAFLDDEILTIGSGEGSASWPLASLPEAPDWARLHAVPTALVTGSNGKTTTVRLVAALCAAAGRRPGFNCTDGVFVGGEAVERGDYSGPNGARTVLRDPRVQVAILETARGGILRRGLAVERADAAIVTNISADHFGEYGVHSLSDLADAKLVVARAIDARGCLVLNADDSELLAKSQALSCPLAWFALDDGHPRLHVCRASGGSSCGWRNGRLILHRDGRDHDLGAVEDMPLSFSGAARYNLANLAGAALLASVLGVSPEILAKELAHFGASREDNPGRLERWKVGGATVLLDYAHNPEGLTGLLSVASHLRQAARGRLGLLLGQAGNRDDDAIAQLAVVAALARPDRVVLKDIDGYMRGREQGEVASILSSALTGHGVAPEVISVLLSELEAAIALIEWARPGDVVVLPVHNLDVRSRLVEWLDRRVVDAG